MPPRRHPARPTWAAAPACLAAAGLLLSGAAPRPALEQLARSVADQTRATSPEAPLALYVDGAPPVLARAFATLLSAELSAHQLPPVVLDAASPSEAEALARQRDLRSVLRVTVALEGDRVWARGDLLPTWVNFWSGASPTRTGPAAVVALSAAADEQTRALASVAVAAPVAPSSVVLSVSVLARLPEVPLAVAALDLDGDKKSELAVLTESAVWLLAGDGRILARSDVHQAPLSPSPAREPFGAVSLAAGPPRVAWASSRHLAGEQLAWASGTLKPLPGVVELQVEGVGLKLLPGLNLFARPVVVGGKPVELPAPFTATSSRAGSTLVVYPDGSAALFKTAPSAARLSGLGAASALADLDGDGTPELVTTSTRFFPDGDEVRVLTLAAAEGLQARGASVVEATPLWRGNTPRGRPLVAVGADLDGDGAEELVLGTWLSDGTGELQVARRAVAADKERP